MTRRRAIAGLGSTAVIVLNRYWLSGALAEANPPSLVFLGFHLINTSLEPTTLEENERLQMIDALFLDQLLGSYRFNILPIARDLRQDIANGPDISACNDCRGDYGRRAGADLVAWGTIQKVSNLILNINLYIEDVRTGKPTFVKSVDIRGNTDESWRRGLDYLLRNYLLQEP